MRSRLRIPTSTIEKVLFFQYIIIQNCITIGGNFMPQINETPICEEFFQRLYVIPKDRFDSLVEQISHGLSEPLPHGNKGKRYERSSTSIRNAQILNQVDSMAEPHPSGASYLLPAGTTKSEVIKRADIKTNLEINPTQEFKRIDKTFHFHKTNSFTKCKACVLLKVAAYNVELSEEDRKEAKIHLKNHYDNIKNDRRDYEIRKLTSLQEVNFLLSLGHDGMSKYLSTFPHLNNDNIKTLSDTMKMACSLNLAIVHRNTIDTPYQLHSFWNIDQMSGAKANAVISQLFYSISHCSPIPSKIAIQLDNCASNKCYTLLGAFGHLLLWIPKLTSIYICTSEVGHTHNDIDQKFGVLASALKMNQIYTPQGYTRFAQEKLKGLATNNLLPTTYDFEAFLRTNVIENGQIAKNHYFELTRQEDNTVTMKIARFLRSEKYISSTSTDSTGFKLFKQPPNANEFPKIVPPNAFDLSKHAKLCKAVKGAMNPSDFEELVNLPKFIEENYQPEPFEDVLKRISDKVVAENITVRVSEDPENDLVDKFLKRINKPWEVNQRETTVNADVRPSKEKSSTSKRSASKSASTNDLPAATANKPEKKQRKK
uniref:DUF7869 domain-containing protein n=1 Tax=Panagrolaimus superbus TaxID=310955 RepID=A0A914YXW4_9BILA